MSLLRSISAILYTIRSCEHLWPKDVANDECYHIFYGGTRFWNMSDHPVITGELKGVSLPPEMCRAAGYASGVCVSTAAGAYQFTKPTWGRLRAMAPRLEDFKQAAQDEAATRLLGQLGALHQLDLGKVQEALRLCAQTWASLPGSTAQQHPKTLEYAMERYNEGLAKASA